MIELRRARPLLGTRVEIAAEAATQDTALAAIRAAFEEVATIHRLLSFHDPASELSRLNREGSRAPQPVDRRTSTLLRRARSLWGATGGAFDPAVAPRLVAAGFLPRPDGAPEPDPAATIDDVVVRPEGSVFFRRPLWLDLGGIAKGLAIDRAVARLRASGVRSGAVEAGGDLRVFGARPRRIALRDPSTLARIVAVVEIANAALASSSPAATLDERGSHLVDPRGGRPLVAPRGATVVARSATAADAWTKAVLFAPERAARGLERAGARALVVDRAGVRWLPTEPIGAERAA